MKNLRLSLLLLALAAGLQAFPAGDDVSRQNLRQYFENYQNPIFPNLGKIKVEDIITDAAAKHTTIVLSENFIPATLPLSSAVMVETVRWRIYWYGPYIIDINPGTICSISSVDLPICCNVPEI